MDPELLPQQVAILRALSGVTGPLCKQAICERSGVPENWLAEFAGTVGCEPMVRRSGGLTTHPKLTAAGLAKVEDFPESGRAWSITRAGREWLRNLDAAAEAAPASEPG